MDRFGTRGVRMAWYDPKKADYDVLQGYTKVHFPRSPSFTPLSRSRTWYVCIS
jgi:hypothetical protein